MCKSIKHAVTLENAGPTWLRVVLEVRLIIHVMCSILGPRNKVDRARANFQTHTVWGLCTHSFQPSVSTDPNSLRPHPNIPTYCICDTQYVCTQKYKMPVQINGVADVYTRQRAENTLIVPSVPTGFELIKLKNIR